MVFVHHCTQDRGIEGNMVAITSAMRGKAPKVDADADIEKCYPFHDQNTSYSYMPGKLDITFISNADSPRSARDNLLMTFATFSVLRVTIIAPAR